jgi:hypothetical protein
MRLEIKSKEQEINWAIPQLVVNINNEKQIVYYYPENETERNFSGIELRSGVHYSLWNKAEFKPFQGTITISND